MKTKLKSLLIGLVTVASTHQTTAQVTNLGIAPVAGGQSLLYWPMSTTNYVLQTITDLSSTNWVTARTAFAVNTADVTNSTPSGFFRLQPTSTPAGMALIPGGWFTMGDTLDGESDAIPTNIYVSAFVMDVNLVNYGLWTNVYAYATSQNYNFAHAGANGGTGTNYPVTTVDWYDCVKWCNARSAQAGLMPVYYTDAGFTQVFTNGDNGTTVYQNLAANGYRLPTEAEWEIAARGGGIGRRFPWGNLIHTNQAQYAACTTCYNYDLGPNNTIPGPSPVGSFDVNGYGLYDMCGNEFEWCWDWYGTPYGQPSTINPLGAGPGIYRVQRGGYYSDVAYYARCATRSYTTPNHVVSFFGFRCVRGL
ncbi:MAG TPA: SUMF1/EgtB/PvdO family nonheme iron enzyme [Candidatus Acidoferrales bacterium]|nr:SUMF1/EgtB/PvdO family nonheme iron enzyme [Candidatus Acidoferrales bacterium]